MNNDRIGFFKRNGYLRLEGVYSPEEVKAMSDDTDYLIRHSAFEAAWKGMWREEYLTDEEDKKASLMAIPELHLFSSAWARAVSNPIIADTVAELLDTDTVELHHSVLHAKAPDTGAPFPMHQDLPFYPHDDDRYVDALVHLDDTDETNGCIKVLKGSHKLGKLRHILEENKEPYLPTDIYKLQDAVSVPARAGDVFLFHFWTVHGSDVNHSGTWRRLVRLGYRHPDNLPSLTEGDQRPCMIVKGIRPPIPKLKNPNDYLKYVYGPWKSKRKTTVADLNEEWGTPDKAEVENTLAKAG